MIEGKKTRLRPVEEGDLKFCQWLFNDARLRQLVVGWDFPTSLAAQQQWFSSLSRDHHQVRFVVENHEGEPLGLTGLWDIDWHNRNALTAIKMKTEGIEGQGFGRDVIMTMNSYAFFDVGMHRLWGLIMDYNIPSFKSYVEKSGWRVEGTLRDHVFRNGRYHNLYYVACLKDDFLSVNDAESYFPQSVPSGMGKFEV